MKKIFLSVTILIIINLFYISLVKAENIPTLPKFEEKIETKNYSEGEIIIKYANREKKSKSFNKIKGKNPDIELKKEIKNKNTILLKSNKKTTQEMIRELKDDPDIELIEPNYKRTRSFIPSDSYFSSQWSIRNTGQSVNGISGTADADIDAEEAWDIESNISNETIVAVIDDGVDHNHSDLINNMWDGSACLDDLGDPIIGGCPNHGWDYQDNDNDPYFNEHGTFVSSLIASQTNNSSGIAGLSRYNKIKIMALKFDFDLFTELEAIDFASYNGAKVINASYSGPDYSEIEKIYIESFDGIFVASAGNASNNNDTAPEYPCSYNSQNVICVASSDQKDDLSSFSNYGYTSVDITAPGENMIGLYKDSYYIGEGTSFSAPLVAGTTALLYSQNPAASINTISETLLKSSDHLSSLDNYVYCSRKLNTNNALRSMINNEVPSENCSKTEIYRFYNAKSDAHLFTALSEEKDWIISTLSHAWKYEGIAFYAYKKENLGTSPVYRFYNPNHDVHFFTISGEEKNWLMENLSYAWRYEGIAYYAYKSPTIETSPVYRFYNPKSDAHLFTIISAEKDWIISTLSHAWKYEDIGYYVPK